MDFRDTWTFVPQPVGSVIDKKGRKGAESTSFRHFVAMALLL
jgi:hypothetical protein